VRSTLDGGIFTSSTEKQDDKEEVQANNKYHHDQTKLIEININDILYQAHSFINLVYNGEKDDNNSRDYIEDHISAK